MKMHVNTRGRSSGFHGRSSKRFQGDPSESQHTPKIAFQSLQQRKAQNSRSRGAQSAATERSPGFPERPSSLNALPRAPSSSACPRPKGRPWAWKNNTILTTKAYFDFYNQGGQAAWHLYKTTSHWLRHGPHVCIVGRPEPTNKTARLDFKRLWLPSVTAPSCNHPNLRQDVVPQTTPASTPNSSGSLMASEP